MAYSNGKCAVHKQMNKILKLFFQFLSDFAAILINASLETTDISMLSSYDYKSIDNGYAQNVSLTCRLCVLMRGEEGHYVGGHFTLLI